MINKHSVSIPSIAQHQSGVVLVISLIMLLALTLIGVTGSRVTSLEEKMAANSTVKIKTLLFKPPKPHCNPLRVIWLPTSRHLIIQRTMQHKDKAVFTLW